MNKDSSYPSSKKFAIVLAGGGARGFAHAGILWALEHEGLRPSAIVGVSMGAVVGVTYSLRDDWYPALLDMDTHTFPESFSMHSADGFWKRAQIVKHYAQTVRDLIYGWGPGMHALEDGQALLRSLTQNRELESGRIPVIVSATDLITGKRVVLRTGNAADAIYASAALAGILPPLRLGDHLLTDGAYSDIAPIDVAKDLGFPVVLAVDPGQSLVTREITSGYQALMRAVEICHLRHADLRFAQADLVLKPTFPHTIDTLDFKARRTCVAAGIMAVRCQRSSLRQLLSSESDPASPS